MGAKIAGADTLIKTTLMVLYDQVVHVLHVELERRKTPAVSIDQNRFVVCAICVCYCSDESTCLLSVAAAVIE